MHFQLHHPAKETICSLHVDTDTHVSVQRNNLEENEKHGQREGTWGRHCSGSTHGGKHTCARALSASNYRNSRAVRRRQPGCPVLCLPRARCRLQVPQACPFTSSLVTVGGGGWTPRVWGEAAGPDFLSSPSTSSARHSPAPSMVFPPPPQAAALSPLKSHELPSCSIKCRTEKIQASRATHGLSCPLCFYNCTDGLSSQAGRTPGQGSVPQTHQGEPAQACGVRALTTDHMSCKARNLNPSVSL